MPSTKRWNLNLFVERWCLRDGIKLKPVVLLSCACGFGNNYMLHSVYFRSLVDLENKNCVGVPLVNIYRQSAWCKAWMFSRLKKSPSNALWKLLEWNCSQTIWSEGLFLDHRDNNNDSLLHNSCFLNQPTTLNRSFSLLRNKKINQKLSSAKSYEVVML